VKEKKIATRGKKGGRKNVRNGVVDSRGGDPDKVNMHISEKDRGRGQY